jgi:fumarylpyruvate hydrolase
LGSITPKEQVPGIEAATIALDVNGQSKQTGTIAQLIWNISETIAQLSAAWQLQPGDLIFTGTPAGVGAVLPGDILEARIAGLQTLHVQLVPSLSLNS